MISEKRLYQFEGSSQHIEHQLADLMLSDKRSEDEAKTHQDEAGKLLLKGILRGGACLIPSLIAYNTMKRGDAQDLVVLLFGGIAMAVFGYFVYQGIKASGRASEARKGDIDDRLYEGLGRLHQYLKLDCHDNAHFKYELDFRKSTERCFVTDQKPYRGGYETHYQMPKLKAQAKLRDGTVLKIQIEYHIRVRAYSKTSASGKVKSKRKTKSKDVYKVSFRLPTELSGNYLPSVSAKNPMVSDTAKTHRVRFSGNRVSAVCQRMASSETFQVAPALQLAVSTLARVNAMRGNN